jgi:putative transposase
MDIVNLKKEYHTDGEFIFSCQYHVIFCPKYRRSVLQEPIAKRMKELVLEKQQEYGYTVLEQEIMPDHVHLLLDVHPKNGVYTIVSKIKGYTSHTLRNEFKELTTKLPTLWTRSYFVSTHGHISDEMIQKYIEEQKGM